MKRFVAGIWLALLLAWLFSGEQFLDLAFAMPNAWVLDDIVLNGIVWLEERRAELGLPDLFAALRRGLHALTGLG